MIGKSQQSSVSSMPSSTILATSFSFMHEVFHHDFGLFTGDFLTLLGVDRLEHFRYNFLHWIWAL